MPKKKLAEYKAKRDFTLTAEPSDQVVASVKPSDRLRFVIQKHAARRLHFDLRLELDGVFKSWAVTRGPSLDPNDKRLAVEVEDHPLAYGDFEGIIPQGQYGGGTVQLWDRGYWRPDVDADPAASLRAGELKFTLEGQRLRGSWVLVRMRRGPEDRDRNNWLLIKHRDQGHDPQAAAATSKLMALDQSVASRRSMAQIAANKPATVLPFMTGDATDSDPPAPAKRGASRRKATQQAATPASSSMQSLPRLSRMPSFIEPQLCKISSAPIEADGWLHELKLDGYRLQLRKAGKKVALLTRNGLDWVAKFPAIKTIAEQLPDCIIDGELVALDREQRPNFGALQVALSAGRTDALVFYVFDLLVADGRDWRKAPLIERKRRLQAVLANLPAPLRFVEHVLGNGPQLWRLACQSKLEGIISKRCDALYVSGRSNSWLKTKCRTGHEVVIGGWTHEGTQLRSLLVGVMQDDHLVYVGRVGTGFGARAAGLVLPRLQALASAKNPFHGDTAPKKMANITWIKPKLVAEIEFAGWTPQGMVRQAAFKGLREDKPASSVRAELPAPFAVTRGRVESVVEEAPAQVRGKQSAAKRPARSQGVKSAKSQSNTVSNPDKALWPAQGQQPAITKQALADYFAGAAAWLLPHIKGRPCSLVRAPDGITGQHFFQRHAMAGPATALRTVKVSGDHAPYLLVNDAAALLAVAQLGGIELHPWNCVADHFDVPGRLVFDLDPDPSVAFDAVIKAALEIRDRLQQMGLTSFCKTTGGKGLHVVVPLRNNARRSSTLNWPTAKLFAQTLCAQMAADQPQRYLINMSKAARKGKIFLDYLRNDRLATAVAPLSPRARVGAPVSMPIDWQYVRRGLDPARYTLLTALDTLAQQRPWSDYAQAAGSLTDASRQLLRTHDASAA